RGPPRATIPHLPHRAWPPADERGTDRPGAASHPRNPAGQTPAPLPDPAACPVACLRRTAARRCGCAADARRHRPPRPAELAAAVRLGALDPVTAAPAALRRRDGRSVYQVSGAQLYTTGRILAAERRILAAAARTDGRTCAPPSVELALLEATANGTELNPG